MVTLMEAMAGTVLRSATMVLTGTRKAHLHQSDLLLMTPLHLSINATQVTFRINVYVLMGT
ncbi:hypothetical protein BIW11_02427 [Tropilaelaps mercedesae]|uniref:Uncharacterized protein n=1 Tax=Tropilaelaps mercedesae TaxID=418985 RepID=A0A1V9Y3C2_9ACAR|nr:hypothetical protein BIW11_02427 [Tropilaelaps mercedesae]